VFFIVFIGYGLNRGPMDATNHFVGRLASGNAKFFCTMRKFIASGRAGG
jgi:hypothetical protein